MKLNKILAGLSATAMAVSMLTLLTTSADAEPVTLTGSHTFAESTTNAGQVEPIVLQMLQSNYNFAPDDTISITVECTSGDSNDWQVAVNAYDTSWGGWGNIASEPGTLTLTTTVADVVGTTGNESISEDLSNLQGLNFNIWEADIGESLTYELKINGGTVSSTDSSEAEDSSSEVVEDSSSEVVEDSSSDVVDDSSSEVSDDSSEADEPTATVPTEDYEIPSEFIGVNANGEQVVFLLPDEENGMPGAFTSASEFAGYVGFTMTITVDDVAAADIANGAWVGGAFGTNCTSTGWTAYEIAFQDGQKPYTWTQVSDNVYEVTFMVEEGTLFTTAEEYAQLFYIDYSEHGSNIAITGLTLLAPTSADVPGDDSTPAGDDSTPAGDESTATGDDSTVTGGDDSTQTPSGSDESPVTGSAALATVGVLLAAAAVIVTKKK